MMSQKLQSRTSQILVRISVLICSFRPNLARAGGHAGGQTQVLLLHVLVDQELPQLVIANRHPQHLAHGVYTDTDCILTQKSQFVYQKSGFQIFNFIFRVDFPGGTAAGPRLPYSLIQHGISCAAVGRKLLTNPSIRGIINAQIANGPRRDAPARPVCWPQHILQRLSEHTEYCGHERLKGKVIVDGNC